MVEEESEKQRSRDRMVFWTGFSLLIFMLID